MRKAEKIQIFGLVGSLILVMALLHFYRNWSLQKTERAVGVFVEYNIGVGITQKYFKFKMKNGQEHKSSVVYTESLEIGDSVLLEYSISDPNIIKVLDGGCCKKR